MNRTLLLPLLMAVALSGCTDDPVAGSATGPSASPSSGSPLPTQVQMVIKTDHGPADLLVGHDVLFVGTHRGGTIQRIDPQTNRVDATVTVGGQLVLESSTSAGGLDAVDETRTWLWACSNTDGTLHQIDPRAMRVTATVEAKCDGGTRTRVGDKLWAVPGPDTHDLLVVDIRSGEVLRRTTLEDPGWGGWGTAVRVGNRVIIGDKRTPLLSKDGRLLRRLSTKTPYLTSTGGDLYRIWPDGSLDELDPKTLAVRRSLTVPPSAGDPVLVADNAGNLYYRPDSTHVYEVGPDGTARLLLTLPPAETPTAMAWAFDSLWITNFDDDTVWRVDPLS
jgi:DNA-binding beta-propeller fold protein YncE